MTQENRLKILSSPESSAGDLAQHGDSVAEKNSPKKSLRIIKRHYTDHDRRIRYLSFLRYAESVSDKPDVVWDSLPILDKYPAFKKALAKLGLYQARILQILSYEERESRLLKFLNILFACTDTYELSDSQEIKKREILYSEVPQLLVGELFEAVLEALLAHHERYRFQIATILSFVNLNHLPPHIVISPV